MTDYIPKREADFVFWLRSFSGLISADAAGYGIDAAAAEELASLTATYDRALQVIISRNTRTRATIGARNHARAVVTYHARHIATIIQGNPATTDAQKTALNLVVRKITKSPILAPTSRPMMSFDSASMLRHVLRFTDSNTPSRRGKPAGVTSLLLWYKFGGTAPADVEGMSYAGNFTKNPIRLDLPARASGQTVYYIAKWCTRRGLFGPQSSVLGVKAI